MRLEIFLFPNHRRDSRYGKNKEKNIVQTLLYTQKLFICPTRILLDKLYRKCIEKRYKTALFSNNLIAFSSTCKAMGFEFVETVEARKTRELSRSTKTLVQSFYHFLIVSRVKDDAKIYRFSEHAERYQ